ncbi:hypothetical protein E4O93_07980 [Diaphorobacter sp. DS2]|nr:hypothetical protein E4O93_07980 [Diaphorobacter sp. DS2]
MTYFTTGAQLQAALNALPNTKTGNFVAFDSFFYGQQYMADYQGTLSPIEHFVQIGAARGYKPNATFDPTYYKNAFADLKNTDFNAADLLYHFMQYGLDEGRTPNAALATFDGTAYLAANPDVAAVVNANLAQFGGSATNGALAHYVKFGAAEGRTAPGTSVSNGQTFTLTSGTDTLTGTAGNDTFTGDVASNQVQASDSVDGGSGTDTLKVFGFSGAAAAATSGTTESAVVTLSPLASGEYITIAGLTLTASGAVTAADVASAFAGATVAKITKSGALAGWTTGGPTATTVTFTSTTPNTNVVDLTASFATNDATAPVTNASFAITQGAAATSASTASVLPSIKNVEVLQLGGALGNSSLDFTNYTKAATGIETVVLDNVAALNAQNITTTAGQGVSLATGASNVATAGQVTWVASATDTSLNLALNGYQGGKGVAPAALTITAASATTQNIASTGAANQVSTLTLGAKTDKVVVTGDQKLTVTTDLVSSGGATILKTVDASASTGGANITLNAATNAAFAFTGGSGNDSVKFADNGLAALTSGAQLDGGAGTGDKIGILDTALTDAEYKAIADAKNFEVLGLNAAVTVDGAKIGAIKSFSLDTNAAQVINKMATGSTVTVAAAHAANIDLAGAVGVNDVSVVVGSAASAGLAVGQLTVGQTGVSLVSNGDGTGTNTIATLVNKDNSVYTITGSNDLTITAATAATATGSKYDASGFTGKLTITGNQTAYAADSGLGDIIIGGSKGDVIKASVNSSTLTGNGGNDTFNVETAVAAAVTKMAITTITDFTKGDKIDFGATAGAFTAAKVDLSGAANEAAAINLLAAGNNSDLKWGVYGGNTYILDDVGAGATIDATDTIVKLTGTLDLSTSTLNATVLTFA